MAINEVMFLEPKPEWDNQRTFNFAYEYFAWFSEKYHRKSNIPHYGYTAHKQDSKLIKSAFGDIGRQCAAHTANIFYYIP